MLKDPRRRGNGITRGNGISVCVVPEEASRCYVFVQRSDGKPKRQVPNITERSLPQGIP